MSIRAGLAVALVAGCLDAPPRLRDRDAARPQDGAGSEDAGVDDDLVAWYRLDDEPTDGILDETGDHHGVCANCPALVDVLDGVGYAFEGTARVDIPNDPEFWTAEGTVAAWIRPDDIGRLTAVSFPHQVGSGNAWLVSTFPGDNVTFQAGERQLTTTVDIPGTWLHVTGTWTDSAAALYIDGEGRGSSGNPGIVFDEERGSLLIGQEWDDGEGYGFVGVISDVRIYCRALSPVEISTLAASPPD